MVGSLARRADNDQLTARVSLSHDRCESQEPLGLRDRARPRQSCPVGGLPDVIEKNVDLEVRHVWFEFWLHLCLSECTWTSCFTSLSPDFFIYKVGSVYTEMPTYTH